MKLLFPLAVVLCVLVAANVVSGRDGTLTGDPATGEHQGENSNNGVDDQGETRKADTSESSSESSDSSNTRKASNQGSKPKQEETGKPHQGLLKGALRRAKSRAGQAAGWAKHTVTAFKKKGADKENHDD